MKPALLVIDLQKEFYDSSARTAQSMQAAFEYINAAIALFRAKNLPIVCIRQVNKKEKLIPGKEGFELPEELNILPSDISIHKTYGNAFKKTSLQSTLHDLDVDTVIVTGYCAEHCVLSTYRGAKDLDLTPILLRGSLASDIPENIRFVESISDVISYGALAKVIG